MEKMKIKINKSTRYGMGESYEERFYHCPLCNKTIMYHNVVTIISGQMQKFCDNCGTGLDWSDVNEP